MKIREVRRFGVIYFHTYMVYGRFRQIIFAVSCCFDRFIQIYADGQRSKSALSTTKFLLGHKLPDSGACGIMLAI